jgi:hypothetical protein
MLIRMVESGTHALQNHIQAENLAEGRPTDILEIHGDDEVSLEETEESLQVLQEAIQRKKLKMASTPAVVEGAGTNGNGTGNVITH